MFSEVENDNGTIASEEMKKVYYTSHLKLRIRLRSIPQYLPKRIYQESRERYYDRETSHYIAIKEVEFKGKVRDMAITYTETSERIEIITVHPLRTYQKHQRIKIGRWKRL